MRRTNKPATVAQLLVFILLCSGSIAQKHPPWKRNILLY